MDILKYGDTIGIISPSWVADKSDYEKYVKGIRIVSKTYTSNRI